ncbi:MAG: efflux RND transporter periplasmic adaptor subunit [Pelomonas sp.]|nr:efflux RND transporter periplasmic adaptor subunit [Roseateles sp.]
MDGHWIRSLRPALVGFGVIALGVGIAVYWGSQRWVHAMTLAQAMPPRGAASATLPADQVGLSDEQARAISVAPAGRREFVAHYAAVGSIDFDENLAVPVFSNYQGKIIKPLAEIGDRVRRGQALYTIDSPDLVNAESGLIAAAGAFELTTTALKRADDLRRVQGLADKDYEQAVSDQMAADASLKSAREAVRVFGKSAPEIDAIVAHRRIDPVLVVASPIDGRVTARAAQPGLLVQPGATPAPYTVADVSKLWLIANVAETDSPAFHAGQAMRVQVNAFPGRVFDARIAVLGATVDPTLHTLIVRAELDDTRHELRPGMLATFDIAADRPVSSTAVPLDGVVREGDGSFSIWVTSDRRRFTRRAVRLGLQQDGVHQVLDGLAPGELVVTKGAILLSNILNGNAGS